MSIDTNKPLAAHVADFVTKTHDIPAETARVVKKHILDTLAVGIAGVPAEGSEIVRRYVEQLGCAGTSTIFGTAQRAAPRFAALANASSMHADDYDDTYHPTRFHPTAPVLSAVFAEAEQSGASGTAVLTAIAVGTVAAEIANAPRGIKRVIFCCFSPDSAEHHRSAFIELGLQCRVG